jgi:hypothetical protein
MFGIADVTSRRGFNQVDYPSSRRTEYPSSCGYERKRRDDIAGARIKKRLWREIYKPFEERNWNEKFSEVEKVLASA